MILDKIVSEKLIYLDKKIKQLPLDIIIKQAKNAVIERRSFKKALIENNEIAIIGEIKKASPSKGLMKKDFNPAELSRQYSKADVQALSVLTERDFFLGDDAYLKKARINCRLPVLRKDFIINEWQIYESYLLKADAILLIAAILDDNKLGDYLKTAQDFKLDALVEVHNMQELDRVLKINAPIIGINNRNLEDFTVSLETTERLIGFIPKDKIIISESGINKRKDVEQMKSIGVDALLIGESLMRADNIADAVEVLRGKK